MKYRVPLFLFFLVLHLSLDDRFSTIGQTQQTNQTPAPPTRCDIALPLPNAIDIGTKKFEKLLYAFLDQGCYKSWVADSEIRNTGHVIGGLSYGRPDGVEGLHSLEGL